MADQKTFVVTLSTGDGKTLNVRIKASSFRIPTGEGGSYVFEVSGAVVAAFTRESVLAVVDEVALAKAEQHAALST
jgi:hypothetical protein